MAFRRTAVPEFELANGAYANAVVTFYQVDTTTLERTTQLATIYDAPAGGNQLENPYILNGQGRAGDAIYIEAPIIAVIGQAAVSDHETGIIYPQSGSYRGDWATGTTYLPGEIVRDGSAGANTANLYITSSTHTSGTWLDDLGSGLWTLIIDVDAIATAAADEAEATIEAELITFSAAVDQDFIPDTDETRDLGSSTKKWGQLHVNEIVMDSGGFFTINANSYIDNSGTLQFYDGSDEYAILAPGSLEISNSSGAYTILGNGTIDMSSGSGAYIAMDDGGSGSLYLDPTNIQFGADSTIQSGTSSGQQIDFQARNTGAGTWSTFITLLSGSTASCAINGATIGATTPAAGTFTTLAVTGSSIPADGVYKPSSNVVGVAAGSSPVAYFEKGGAGGNYIRIQSASTGGGIPAIRTTSGVDTNVSLGITSLGTGALQFYTNNAGTLQFLVYNTTSAVNYLTATGGATGSPGVVTLGAGGSDSNIDLALNPKGTGILKPGGGSFVANGSVATALSSVGPTGANTTVQEWLAVKSGANTRYIPCF